MTVLKFSLGLHSCYKFTPRSQNVITKIWDGMFHIPGTAK